MNDSTTPDGTPAGTPAAGRPFPGLRRRLTGFVGGPVGCDECGTELDSDAVVCRTCAQRRRRRAGLETVIECYAGDRPWTTVVRSDEYDGTRGPTPETGDEPEGWPW